MINSDSDRRQITWQTLKVTANTKFRKNRSSTSDKFAVGGNKTSYAEKLWFVSLDLSPQGTYLLRRQLHLCARSQHAAYETRDKIAGGSEAQ
jgi:hypothetical protein